MKYFKWFINVTVLAFIFTGLAIAQVELNPDQEKYEFREIPLSENARIEFDHTVFDFGAMNKGSTVAHSYWFKNTGTDTLVITKIKSTCGCTSTKEGGIIAAPGESASIDIIFNSGKFNGRLSKSIKIETNDKLNPYMEIRFKATINDPLFSLEYMPFEADFKAVAKGKSETFKISITNKDTTVTNLEIVDKPQESFIKTELDQESLQPGDSAKLTFILMDDIKPGEYLSSVTLEDKDKKHSRFSIPITVTITDGGTVN
jgi:hypothetical protein